MSTDATFPVTPEFLNALKRVARVNNFSVEATIVVDARRSPTGRFFTGGVALCIKEKVKTGFGVSEVEARIEQEALARIQRYGESAADDVARYVDSQTRYVSTELGSAVATLANLVRVGDELLVHFVIGNSNSYLKEAGLEQDEADVVVYRKGRIVGTAHVGTRVAPTQCPGGRMADPFYRQTATV